MGPKNTSNKKARFLNDYLVFETGQPQDNVRIGRVTSLSAARLDPRGGVVSGWVVVARIPQIDGRVREVLVERRHATEVREVLRQTPARIDGLWCATRVREVA